MIGKSDFSPPELPALKGGPLRDMRQTFRIGEKEFAAPLWIIGPDVIEDEGFAVEVAHVIAEAAQRRNLPVIFKASYEKANRSSTDSFRGPGLEKACPSRESVKRPDFRSPPTFMTMSRHNGPQKWSTCCRSRISLSPELPSKASAATGKIVNLKKGQFFPLGHRQPCQGSQHRWSGG